VVVAPLCPAAASGAPRCTTTGEVSYNPSVTSTSVSLPGATSCAATMSPSPRLSCSNSVLLSRTTTGTSFSFISFAKRASNSCSYPIVSPRKMK
jgi:hypothetical protein